MVLEWKISEEWDWRRGKRMEFQGGSRDVEKEELVKQSEALPERKGQKITN